MKTAGDKLAGPEMAEARKNVEDEIANVKTSIQRAQDAARQKLASGVHGTETYVQDNPWQAIALAQHWV